VIIGKERLKSLDDKIWPRDVALEKVVDGKETLKITMKVSGLGGGGGQASSSNQDWGSIQ
jgi:hypothetical protein